MSKRVFVTRDLPETGLSQMRRYFEVAVWSGELPPTRQEIVREAQECEGLVTLLSDPIDSGVITSLPHLRVIAQYAVGFDNIDVKSATALGVMVTNTPGVLTETTADLTWSLIMAASRRVVEADRYVREGSWRVAWGPKLLLGVDIHDSTIGIIGMGRIGSAVARRAQGFGMRIIYVTQDDNEATRQVEAETKAVRTDLDTLLSEADIVTLHVPLTKETRHMIGPAQLKRMKRGAVLVNTSRGSIVDEDALYESLKSGQLHAAGLDVFETEPLPTTSRLIALPNVVLAPHIGSASFATRSRMAEMCASNLIAALKGRPPPNIVNPEVLRK